MKAYIHGFQGKAYNSDCQTALEGFEKLGIETVLFTTNEEFDTRAREDVVVGGTVIIWHALNEYGINAGSYDYPKSLSGFLGRKTWDTTLKDIKRETLPFFMKPVEDKIAPGLLIESWEDLEEYSLLDSQTKVHCSEPVNFISEWRCFVLYGQIVGVQYYYGDRAIECNQSVLEAAVKAYHDMPTGFAMDFGVTDDGRTLLVEVNDGYSLGTYGLDATLYARLLAARWAELVGTEDILKSI